LRIELQPHMDGIGNYGMNNITNVIKVKFCTNICNLFKETG